MLLPKDADSNDGRRFAYARWNGEGQGSWHFLAWISIGSYRGMNEEAKDWSVDMLKSEMHRILHFPVGQMWLWLAWSGARHPVSECPCPKG